MTEVFSKMLIYLIFIIIISLSSKSMWANFIRPKITCVPLKTPNISTHPSPGTYYLNLTLILELRIGQKICATLVHSVYNTSIDPRSLLLIIIRNENCWMRLDKSIYNWQSSMNSVIIVHTNWYISVSYILL